MRCCCWTAGNRSVQFTCRSDLQGCPERQLPAPLRGSGYQVLLRNSETNHQQLSLLKTHMATDQYGMKTFCWQPPLILKVADSTNQPPQNAAVQRPFSAHHAFADRNYVVIVGPVKTFFHQYRQVHLYSSFAFICLGYCYGTELHFPSNTGNLIALQTAQNVLLREKMPRPSSIYQTSYVIRIDGRMYPSPLFEWLCTTKELTGIPFYTIFPKTLSLRTNGRWMLQATNEIRASADETHFTPAMNGQECKFICA